MQEEIPNSDYDKRNISLVNTMQWPNEKGQKDKQWYTKYYTEN
jgi:hypothetical protein